MFTITRIFTPSEYTLDKPLFLDIETHGSDYNDVRSVQLYQEGQDVVQVLDTNEYPLIQIYEAIKDFHVVAHNYSFEASCFANDLKLHRNPFERFSDTFLLARIALPRLGAYNLAAVAKYVHGEDYYARFGEKKDMQLSFLDSGKSNKRAEPLTEDQVEYAALDVWVMPKIYNELKSIEPEFIIQLDYKAIAYIQKWQFYGLPVDRTKWLEYEQRAFDHIAEAEKVLGEVNINSFAQVRKFLDRPGSDDQALAEYINQGVPGAAEVRDKRKYVKQLNFLKRYDKDRITGFFSPRTISGRTASDSDNLQQIPRELKGLFGFSKEDSRYIVHADYAALELRGVACIINETILETLMRSGEDLHKYAAANIYKKPQDQISKDERMIGKFANFTLGYGAGANRFKDMLMKQAGLLISESEARKIVTGWKNGYPSIKAWHQVNNRKFEAGRPYDTTLSGRDYTAKLYTDLNAIKIQGSCAEVFKLAMVYLSKKDYKIMNAIHDSFLIEAQDIYEAREVGANLAKAMIVAWFEIMQQSLIPDLPMPTDAEIAKNWGAIEKGEAEEVISFQGTYEEYLSFREEVFAW